MELSKLSEPKPHGHDIIVIGASAGGVEALQLLLRELPRDLPAAVFVVLHVSPKGEGLLPRILNRVCALPAAHPQEGETIQQGRIYVAPPDHHLLLDDGCVRRSEKRAHFFQQRIEH